MQKYEYKVVPAPRRSQSVRGAKKPEDRFAQTLALVMNELGADGWEYLRADILPVEERRGLTSRVTVYHNLLVFRRPLEEALPQRADPAATEAAPAPVPPAAAAPAAAEPRVPAAAPAPLPYSGPRLAADRGQEPAGPRPAAFSASRSPAPVSGSGPQKDGPQSDHAAE
jgi:hypothetical protein